ncbi:hypothetical protein ACWDTI_09630 [Gordonia sp. NPDC003424]
MTRLIPRWLTSHRAVLVALLALVAVAVVVSVVDTDFAYRPGQLALSLLISVVVCGAVTYACAAVVRVPPGADSWLITGLILFFVLPGVTDAGSAWTVAVGAAAAALSKYVLVWRRRLVINPAVAGAVVVYALAYAGVGSIGFPQWWVAAEPLLIPMIVIGALLVTVLRQWWLVAMFLVAAVITIGVVDATQGGQSLSLWLTSSPMLFVAAIMLPEPLTSPTTRWHRAIYAVLVGVLMYWQVSIPITDGFTLEFVPEVALLVGSLYAFVVRLATRHQVSGRVSLDLVAPVPDVSVECASVPVECASVPVDRASVSRRPCVGSRRACSRGRCGHLRRDGRRIDTTDVRARTVGGPQRSRVVVAGLAEVASGLFLRGPAGNEGGPLWIHGVGAAVVLQGRVDLRIHAARLSRLVGR